MKDELDKDKDKDKDKDDGLEEDDWMVSVPFQIDSLNQVLKVETGQSNCYLIDCLGQVFSWGSN